MAMQALKLVFAGTPEFSARHLQALIDGPHDILAVYTQPDRAAGRGKKPRPSPVKMLAEAHALPIRQPVSLRDAEAQAALAALDADLMVVVAYGLILPQTILDTPRLGCINVHASLLPRWRGAAPIERALMAGDKETGVTIMQMDAGLDTGDMLYKVHTAISEQDNREDLEARLANLGCEALLHTLANYPALRASAKAQDNNLSTYASKLEKHEAQIDWSRSARQISRQIRAGVGRLPAWTALNGQRIRLLQGRALPRVAAATPGTIVEASADNGLHIACAEGVLEVHQLQLPGKNPVSVRDALNARSALFAVGNRFHTEPTA